jgi:hypothetical protein
MIGSNKRSSCYGPRSARPACWIDAVLVDIAHLLFQVTILSGFAKGQDQIDIPRMIGAFRHGEGA